MIKINNKVFKNYDIKTKFNKCLITQDNLKLTVDALYISLSLKGICLDIETSYDKKKLFTLKVNDTEDIFNYLIGIPYDDKNGWMYLEKNKTTSCYLTKINENMFNIKLNGIFEECDETINIEIDFNFNI